MYKVNSVYFMHNNAGATLATSFTNEKAETKCIVVTKSKTEDSENVGKEFDSISHLQKIAKELERAESLRLDVDFETNQEEHTITFFINNIPFKTDLQEALIY